MHPEDRRKIIEEVAGIAIYESRKEKSLHELEKMDEKMKEISTILRERTAFLKNLEREKQQAEKFKELELTIKRCKASILHKKQEEKMKEIESINKSINEKSEQRTGMKENADSKQVEIENIGERINQINKSIQQASGLEQESLHNETANLRAELEGLRVRRENFENRKNETDKRIEQVSNNVPDLEKEIEELRSESPLIAKKSEDLRKKKTELSNIEEERNEILTLRTELSSLKERIRDKEKQFANVSAESNSVLKQMEENADLEYKTEREGINAVANFEKNLSLLKEKMVGNEKGILEGEKKISVNQAEIKRYEEIKGKVQSIDICPLCQTKIEKEHKGHVIKEADEKTDLSLKEIRKIEEKLMGLKRERKESTEKIEEIRASISRANIELVKHKSMHDKQERLKRLVEEEKALKNEIRQIEDKRRKLELNTNELGNIQVRYDSKMLEIEEVSSRTEEDVDTTLLYKERELENLRNIIKTSQKNLDDISSNIKEIEINISGKEKKLEEGEEKERNLNLRFKKMFEDREKLQNQLQEINFALTESRKEIREMEEQINYLKIGKAQVDAQKEALDMEMAEFVGIELIKASINVLDERLKKTQESLSQIGSINMRALEVYDNVKKEYDIVQDKVNILEKEKIGILKIIEEIDKKKTREFMKTFKAMNELFSQNFAKLSNKGHAYLEIENKEDIFWGGVNIVVKLAKGKYFDVTSLSGGEQTLVALSLLFAIQEHKPYHFYILDEIDAALDKRNSERLAALLNQYMKSGQYIVITHNDAIIMNSNLLYGISMHDGVSKVLSLKVN